MHESLLEREHIVQSNGLRFDLLRVIKLQICYIVRSESKITSNSKEVDIGDSQTSKSLCISSEEILSQHEEDEVYHN